MLKWMLGLAILWLGILGGAITLFANLLAPLDMADWAWWIVGHWQEGAPAFWDLPAGWLGIEVPSLLVPPLNIATFLLLTAIGVRIRDHRHGRQMIQVYPVFHLVGGTVVLCAIGYMALASQSQADASAGVPIHAPLAIFLAGATVSFSPPIVGQGDLIRRLWFIFAGVGVLVALNELTKVTLELVAPQAAG